MSTTPEQWFHQLATHYVEAQIYFHLNQSGVFGRLHAGATVSELASELQLDEHVLGCLLDYASNIGEIIRARPGGGFELTPFGHEVTTRYGRSNGDEQTYNIFDVRVGAWGPVWSGLGDMLRRSKAYGVDIHRAGEFAADGLFKLAAPLAGAVERIAQRVEATAVVEIGPTSGIMAMMASSAEGTRGRRYVGVDIKPQSLAFADRLARQRGVDAIEWIEGDLFQPDGWLCAVAEEQRVLYFSCHFHEFLSQGRPQVIDAVRALTAMTNTAGVMALEQPRLEPEQREQVSSPRWLYTQSNVLIHHLIKNARILSGLEWSDLLTEGGCSHVWTEETDGYAFNAYVGSSLAPRGAGV